MFSNRKSLQTKIRQFSTPFNFNEKKLFGTNFKLQCSFEQKTHTTCLQSILTKCILYQVITTKT